MEENEILSLGFKKNKWIDEGETFTEYFLGSEKLGIMISGITLVEIVFDNDEFITVPNCKTIEDLKQLMRLFNIF